MGSRHENSKNQFFSSSTEIKEEADKNDNGISGAAVAGAALLAMWGLSKLLGSSTVSEADKNDNGVSGGVAVGVTVVAGAVAFVVWGLSKLFGLAVWSLSKLFGSTKPEENYNMPMASSSSTVSRDCYKPQHRSSDYDDDNKWTKREHGLLKFNTDASLFPKIDKAVAQTQHGLLKLNTDASLFPKIDKAVAQTQHGLLKLNTDASLFPKIDKAVAQTQHGLLKLNTDASLFPKIDKAVAQTQHGLLKLNTDASLFPKIDKAVAQTQHGLLKLNTDASLFPEIDKVVAQTQHGFLKLNTDASLLPEIDKAVVADATLMKHSLKWTKPEYGWFKLNTDASVLPKKGYKASAGGLIRDHTGRWIVGFTASLKPCYSTSAELQALRVGLLLAWMNGLKKVKIETDSKVAVILIQNLKVNSENHPLGCIIEKCRDLMKRDWNIELNHICREKNSCADALADMGMYQIVPLIILNETPANVQTLVSTDMIN